MWEGMEIYLKLENVQETGSFKVRGALNFILSMPNEQALKGVVTASAGNHGQGVAWASAKKGIHATIFMPSSVSITKLLSTKAHGAEVRLEGEGYDDSAEAARKWAAQRGATYIHAFDDEHVIAGQGTVALEILDQLPEFDSIVVPVGGGGLIAGVATVIKNLRPQVEIIGVQADAAPSLTVSLQKHEPLTIPSRPTIADGIAVAHPGTVTFKIIKEMVDSVVAVREDSLEKAVITFLEKGHVVVEGAGAAPLACLLEGTAMPRGRRVVLLVSGGNLDLPLMDRIIQRGTLTLGRRMRLRVLLSDRPGSLHRITGVIAKHGANIVQVYHDRLAPEHPVHLSKVDFDLEIRSPEDAALIMHELKGMGIQIIE
jgi:threonine dehydratase